MNHGVKFLWTILLLTPAAIAQTDMRVATWNIETIGAPGSAEYNAALDVLDRIGADVVGINEIATAADAADFVTLANAAGYPYTFVPTSNPFGGDRNAFMSVYPITASIANTSAGLSGDAGANDITRLLVEVTIDTPGNDNDLTLVVNHWKSGTGNDDEFRRALESYRCAQAVADLDTQTDAFIVLGDVNEELDSVPRTPNPFTTAPSGLPGSFSIGSDILAEMAGPGLENNPFYYLEQSPQPNMTAAVALQLDGSDSTRPASGRRLDYLMLSQALINEGYQAEVYDSMDEGLGGGLPKFGSPLGSSTSLDAADHLLVFVDVTVPGGGGCTSCPATVSSFPYDEDFEGGFGSWSNTTGDVFDWTRDANGTPSTGTGPSGDHTTGSGWYLYTEGSSPRVPGDTAILDGPCFDLSGESDAFVSFWYHMYGSDVGSLTLQASTDCSSWTSIWSESGNQGNVWLQENVDLTGYAGGTVALRYVSVRGSNWPSDIAIDDITVDAGSNPGCTSGSQCNDFDPCTTDLCVGGVCQNNMIDCNDGNACTVDSCSGGICFNTCPSEVSSFPYEEEFSIDQGIWSNVSGDDFDWTRDANGTPSSSTGPGGDHTSGSGYYMYTETSSPRVSGDTAILESSCFYLGSASDATFSFWYNMYGATIGTLDVDVSSDCTSWTNVWSLSGNQGTSWQQANIDLGAFAGDVITIRFVGVRGSSYTGDIAIDDIALTLTSGGCTSDSQCDDGLFCNGLEACVAGSCIPAATGGVSNGGFSGSGSWSSSTAQGGSITYANNLNVVGPDAGSQGFAWSSQSGVDVNGANLVFDLLSYASGDSAQWDYPVFYLDGTFYGLNADGTLGAATGGGTGGSGTISNGNQTSSTISFSVDIEAIAGPGSHTIGFGVQSSDGSFGAGTAVFDNVGPGAGPCGPGQTCNEATDSCN